MRSPKPIGFVMRQRFSIYHSISPAVQSRPYHHNLRHSPRRRSSTAISTPDALEHAQTKPKPRPKPFKPPPLAILPLPYLLRSYLLALVSTTPMLLNPSLTILSTLTHSRSRFLSPEHNPLLRWLLKRTFYAHFCAGENEREVSSTVRGLDQLGFQGVILTYAKEVEAGEGESPEVQKRNHNDAQKVSFNISPAGLSAVNAWRDNTLLTLKMASPTTDLVALKFSGAGPAALHALTHNLSMPPPLYAAARNVCDLARERRISVLVDAEQCLLQPTVDQWTLGLQERYNTADKALVYSTYQTYRRAAPRILAEDLSYAAEKGFALGVKLVRGAYLAHDPRKEFWASKEETDECFDGITEALCRREWGRWLEPSGEKEAGRTFPSVDLMLATHNRESVRKALALQRNLPLLPPQENCSSGSSSSTQTRVSYAQLLGMADEVSCELITTLCSSSSSSSSITSSAAAPSSSSPEIKVYKYATWGTLGECLKYLLRRAQENKDAVGRAREGRKALGAEIVRRIKVGLLGV